LSQRWVQELIDVSAKPHRIDYRQGLPAFEQACCLQRALRQRAQLRHWITITSNRQSLTTCDAAENLAAMVPKIPDSYFSHEFNVSRVRH
jgi:hypothetical protein